MKKIVLLLFVFSTTVGLAQKKELLETKEEVVEAATRELDAAMQPPEGELYLFKQENGIKGEYVMDIQVHEKGQVAAVFCSGSEGGDIKQQNKLKDKIFQFEFGFKVPKGKRYKFQYIFKFD